MFLASRSIILCGLLVLLSILFIASALLYDTSALFSYASFDTVFNSWRNATSMHGKLTGSLSPEIYTLFEQVYSERPPPPLELEQIAKACAASQYKPDLYIQCDLGVGGFTTLMSQIKTCLNIAFWMGANIVIPTTPLRNSENIANFDEAHIPLGKWIDRDFLIERIQKACPKTKFALLDNNKKPNIDFGKSVYVNPCEPGALDNPPFCSVYGPYAADDNERAWKGYLDGKLQKVLDDRSPEELGNLMVTMPASGLFFNRTSDLDYQHQFFEELHLLRAIEPIRDIIAELVAALSSSPNQLDIYYGVHFRAEEDAVGEVKNGWKTAEEQLKRVFKYADAVRIISHHDQVPKVMYLACGEQDKIEMFRGAASVLGWTVVDKWSIAESVGPSLTAKINALDFDHMAIIDLAMLLVSDWFIGTAESAFSFTIAHDRNPYGRFHGNYLELDAAQIQERPDVVMARTHLFDIGEEDSLYQCCL